MSRTGPRIPQTPAPKAASSRRYQMVDLARLAGVSVSTVSRALSDHPLIKPETRLRIHELARSLNYQVNSGAANLRKQDNNTVGVIFLGDSLQQISDPFILSLFGHIADELHAKGMQLLLLRVDPKHPQSLAHAYERGLVSGLLIVGQAFLHEELNRLHTRNIPMVVWGAITPGNLYCTVGSDNERGGYLATQHLLQEGCRNIVFVGDTRHPEIDLRHRGFIRALSEAGLEEDPSLHIPVLFGDQLLRSTVKSWVDQGHPIDGVFASSDVAALTIVSALNDAGRKVPDEVKVVGFDDIALASFMHPSLTSVKQPTLEAAKAMVDRLLQLMSGHTVSSQMLETELIFRESSRSLHT